MSGPFRYVSVGVLVSAAVAALPAAFAQEALPARKAVPLTAVEEAALKSTDSFRECQECPEMVVVPRGGFTMGSSKTETEDLVTEGKRWFAEEKYAVERYRSEFPEHEVTIARPFAVGKFEVTFREWDACRSRWLQAHAGR
jgi:formylglycine-generating enzyme required for sulfatase activity